MKRHVKATQANATPVTDGRVVVVVVRVGRPLRLRHGRHAAVEAGPRHSRSRATPASPTCRGASPARRSSTRGWSSCSATSRRARSLPPSISRTARARGRRRATRSRRGARRCSTRARRGTELVTSGSLYYRGYDPLTGKELWRLRDGGEVKVPSPVIANDLFYLTGGNPRGREFYVMRPNASGDVSLPAGQESSASVAWRKQKGSPYTPTPIVYDDHLYVCNDNGVLTVYDAAHRRAALPAPRLARPTARSARRRSRRLAGVYFSSEDGEVFVVKAGPVYELLCDQPHGRAADGDAGGVGRDDPDSRPAAPVCGEVGHRGLGAWDLGLGAWDLGLGTWGFDVEAGLQSRLPERELQRVYAALTGRSRRYTRMPLRLAGISPNSKERVCDRTLFRHRPCDGACHSHRFVVEPGVSAIHAGRDHLRGPFRRQQQRDLRV